MILEIPVHLRWSDMDAYGHVNNVEFLRLLEQARISAFWHVDGRADAPGTAILDASGSAGLVTLVARQEIEYLAPLEYQPEPIVVKLWLAHLGGASIDVCYEVCDAARTKTYARAVTTLVLIDTATSSPRRIGPREREAWEPYVDEPIKFRRRA